MLGQSISDAGSFRREAGYQRVCACCGEAHRYHAHHVVEKRLLRRLGLPLYDVRGSMRLCAPPRQCHLGFEAGMVAIPLTRLSDEHVAYAYEVLGSDRAREVGAEHPYDYLRRRYSGDDPRVTL